MHPKAAQAVYGANDAVVATAGTAVQCPNLPTTRGLYIVAPLTNAANVHVGASTVTNESGAQQGMVLNPGGMFPVLVEVANANLLWANANADGDKVGFIAI